MPVCPKPGPAGWFSPDFESCLEKWPSDWYYISFLVKRCDREQLNCYFLLREGIQCNTSKVCQFLAIFYFCKILTQRLKVAIMCQHAKNLLTMLGMLILVSSVHFLWLLFKLYVLDLGFRNKYFKDLSHAPQCYFECIIHLRKRVWSFTVFLN